MSEEFEYIERIAGLIIKHHRNELSEEEALDLRVWCAQSKHNQSLFERLSDVEFIKEGIRELPDIQTLKVEGWEKVMAGISLEAAPEAESGPVGSEELEDMKGVGSAVSRADAVPMRRWGMRVAIAAAILGVLLAGGWLLFRGRTSPAIRTPMLAVQKNDVAPGGNRAVLTLADGGSVVLDSMVNGTIAQQAGKEVRQSSGVLIYGSSIASSTDAAKAGLMAYNTLTTPAAGQFQVVLPDGSKVWLNNASSLKYPVQFSGSERLVELTGEGYFEVAKDAARPFHVRVGGIFLEVLGTSFNISAYKDEENVDMTLLTGGVRVVRGNEKADLKPGEQVRASAAGAAAGDNGSLTIIKDIDTEGVIAWKNGFFHFDHASLQTVMRQLARWYDVDVVYAGAIPQRMFGGDIQRNLNLSQVLGILQKNQVHFDLEGRRITVRP